MAPALHIATAPQRDRLQSGLHEVSGPSVSTLRRSMYIYEYTLKVVFHTPRPDARERTVREWTAPGSSVPETGSQRTFILSPLSAHCQRRSSQKPPIEANKPPPVRHHGEHRTWTDNHRRKAAGHHCLWDRFLHGRLGRFPLHKLHPAIAEGGPLRRSAGHLRRAATNRFVGAPLCLYDLPKEHEPIMVESRPPAHSPLAGGRRTVHGGTDVLQNRIYISRSNDHSRAVGSYSSRSERGSRAVSDCPSRPAPRNHQPLGERGRARPSLLCRSSERQRRS